MWSCSPLICALIKLARHPRRGKRLPTFGSDLIARRAGMNISTSGSRPMIQQPVPRLLRCAVLFSGDTASFVRFPGTIHEIRYLSGTVRELGLGAAVPVHRGSRLSGNRSSPLYAGTADHRSACRTAADPSQTGRRARAASYWPALASGKDDGPASDLR